MSTIKITSEVLTEIRRNLSDITGPGEGIASAPLADQTLCASFDANPEGLEVELLTFTMTEKPTRRFKMVGPEKNIAQDTHKFQATGIATVMVGTVTATVKMHLHTVASFPTNGKLVLRGQTGEITSGRNAGKKWLSLKPLTETTVEQISKFLDTVAKPATATTGAVPAA